MKILYLPTAIFNTSDYQNDKYWNKYFDLILSQGVKTIAYKSVRQASGGWVTNNTDTTKNTYDSTTKIGVLYLNSGVTSIGGGNSTDYSPFYYDTGLTDVDFTYSGITTLSSRVFSNCSLKSVHIPSGVTSINNSTFYFNQDLEYITVASGNTTFNDGKGSNCVIETSSNKLIVGCAHTVIPDGIVSIGKDAFVGNRALTSITIPDSVTMIDEEAFDSCMRLSSLIIGSGVTSIKTNAFGAYNNLRAVTCLATTPPTLGSGNFSYHSSNSTLYVPSASVSAYQADSAWSAVFTTITAIP